MAEIDNVSIGRDWFIGTVGDVFVNYMQRRLDDDEFGRYIVQVGALIDAAPNDRPRGVLFELVQATSANAVRRKQIAEVLTTRRRKLARIIVGCVFVTPSLAVRSVMTAVAWMTSPDFEIEVSANTQDGFRWLQKRLPQVDAELDRAQYEALKQRCLAQDRERPSQR